MLFDWGSFVPDANALWQGVEIGGELRLIGTVFQAQLPVFNSFNGLQAALLKVKDHGATIVSLGLTGSGLTAVAAVLLFIAWNSRNCINTAGNIFKIPIEAISSSNDTLSRASGSSTECPPVTAAPNCIKYVLVEAFS